MNTLQPPALDQMEAARQQGWRSQDAVEQALDGACQAAARHVFTTLYPETARLESRVADERYAHGLPSMPLSGVLVTIKDLYDVRGEVTRAGSLVFSDQTAAIADAVVVERLRRAGAVILGKTNMTELAFSGIGINPHYGTPISPFDPRVQRVPGGSSAGAAVSVALGLASVALGSDTGGSIRIPAAWCGLVGFKPSQTRVPTAGVCTLSHSLDTVCAMARSVFDIRLVDGVLSQQDLARRPRGVCGLRLALPKQMMQDDLDLQVQKALQRALDRLARAGAILVEVDWPEWGEISDIQTPAGFSAIECWASHRHLLADRLDRVDPRVVARLRPGMEVSAADYLNMKRRRADWILRVQARLSGFDAWLAPTVPMVAPELEPLLASENAFMKANRLALSNTFVANFMDACSISLPMQQEGELPTGLMLSSVGGDDASLLDIAQAVEYLLRH